VLPVFCCIHHCPGKSNTDMHNICSIV
jgi:hypothetical protein